MVNARQLRSAQHLLGWTSAKLAELSGVSFVTVVQAQLDTWATSVSGADLWAIRRTLEQAGVEFVTDDRGMGVRLRPAS